MIQYVPIVFLLEVDGVTWFVLRGIFIEIFLPFLLRVGEAVLVRFSRVKEAGALDFYII